LAHTRFIGEYRKSSVQGATPLQLVIMLYDGALRHMEAGKHAMASGNLEVQNASLQKAQRILFELIACLDMEGGKEIAANLLALYTYVIDQLVQANVNDDPDAVERGIKVVSDLRESWVQIERTTRGHGHERQKAA
jgi:flagellar protein FliS